MKGKTHKKLSSLKKHTSFTSQDAHRLQMSTALLAYYVKQGILERVGRGIYRHVDAPLVCDDFRFEDLVLALQKVHDGVICLISALMLYDLTEEIPRQHWIAIRNSTRHRAMQDIKIVRMRNLTLGVTTMNIGGALCKIFDRERTIIDSFRYLGIEIALKALKFSLAKKGLEKIDLKKLQKYAKKLRVNIEPYLLAITL